MWSCSEPDDVRDNDDDVTQTSLSTASLTIKKLGRRHVIKVVLLGGRHFRPRRIKGLRRLRHHSQLYDKECFVIVQKPLSVSISISIPSASACASTSSIHDIVGRMKGGGFVLWLLCEYWSSRHKPEWEERGGGRTTLRVYYRVAQIRFCRVTTTRRYRRHTSTYNTYLHVCIWKE